MANFAKHIDSPSRRKIQRRVDESNFLKGTVSQNDKGYSFTGVINGRQVNGHFLGNDRQSAYEAVKKLDLAIGYGASHKTAGVK